jgi:cytochrome P450
MLSMSDPPQHTRLRRLVSKGFTPRMIRLVEDGLRKRTIDILDDMAERTECDFLVDVAAELPLQATCEFMGIPVGRRYDLFKWTNALVDHGEGADYGITEAATEAAMDISRELQSTNRHGGCRDQWSGDRGGAEDHPLVPLSQSG